MGDGRYERFIAALSETAPVSIRLNPLKTDGCAVASAWDDGEVPWCKEGHYLKSRPDFTFDPLLHAGAYYVQEASSMFVCHVLRSLVHEPVTMLDLCAAPGGKSTAARAVLPEGSLLYSNEPIRQRYHILEENLQKWGHPDVVATNRYPRDYARSGMTFDVILCDVPCSGEGMFRKDEGAVGEWSEANVRRCQQLQRDIVSEAWQCLRPGGYLIYSTCTYNAHENEENIAWMLDTLEATPVVIPTEASWGITGPLAGDPALPLYRFIPGFTKGEGLFMAVVKKEGLSQGQGARGFSEGQGARGKGQENTSPQVGTGRALSAGNGPLPKLPNAQTPKLPDSQTPKLPGQTSNVPTIDVDYPTAIAYLRGEAVVLPADTPRGPVTIGYQGLPLGQAKNIGTRANNLYPKPWRIRSQAAHEAFQLIEKKR